MLEANRTKAGATTKGFDDALLRARAQAERYARALPAREERPPFLVVVDVGHVIELYAVFSRSGDHAVLRPAKPARALPKSGFGMVKMSDPALPADFDMATLLKPATGTQPKVSKRAVRR